LRTASGNRRELVVTRIEAVRGATGLRQRQRTGMCLRASYAPLALRHPAPQADRPTLTLRRAFGMDARMNTIARIFCVSTALLATVAQIGADEPPDSRGGQAREVYDFGKMTEEEAERLDGKQVKVRARLLDHDDFKVGIVWYCDGGGARWLDFSD